MKHLNFFFKHAVNNMNRNRQRTFFVLFCIGVGVSAVVALRSLGLMIGDVLTSNLQAETGGDMVIQAPFTGFDFGDEDLDFSLIENGEDNPVFSSTGVEEIGGWLEDQGYTVSPSYRQASTFVPAQARRADNPENAEAISIYFIDEENYPFYRDVTLVAPTGGDLADAWQEPTSIIISDALAQDLGVTVGEKLRISGVRDDFTITAIADSNSESSLINLGNLFSPFVYLSYQAGQEMFERQPNVLYVAMPEGTDVVAAEEAFNAEFPGMQVRTTEDARELNEVISDELARLITVMGVISLLIGGIGIVNTMTVVVRRRATEIGVLKTIGVQGRQITFMFMLEAFLLGILGSIFGVLMGIGLTAILQRVGERFTSRPLEFAVYPSAIFYGMVTGIIVTLIFGFLPTLAAGRVRPNIVLNPQDNVVPKAGIIQTIVSLLVLVLVMGLLVGNILDNYLVGILGTLGVLLLLGVAVLILWVFVVILSILPSFGSVRLKLAQRAIGTQRVRTANTLLALLIGMFGLSTVLLLTQNFTSLINNSFEEIGGNVLVFPSSYGILEEIETKLAEVGVDDYSYDDLYNVEIVAVNGEPMDDVVERALDVWQTENELTDEQRDDEERFDFDRFLISFYAESLAVERDGGEETYNISDGESFSDNGSNELILQANNTTDYFGFEVGDEFTFKFGNDAEQTVTLVGFQPEAQGTLQIAFDSETLAIVSADSVPEGVVPEPPLIFVNAPDDQVDDVVFELTGVEGALVLEASLINSLVTAVADLFAAIPLTVAVLALFAGSVIIANTVSLATLERRREIGIMKAVGMQSNQVLSLLLIENGLIGLVGGLFGAGLGAVAAIVLSISADAGFSDFPFGTLALLIGLGVLISVVATLVTAVGASREKPLIVLRYD